MEVAEAMGSRPPLAALSLSQQNTEADVDFSKLTPSQFGISTQSFLPSPKIKDKSRLAQLKARRRSTVGLRGSPETNSLICFRAKQAAKTPPRTPQLFQGSPFVSRCDSLKKKMAAFQCLMEDDEEKDEQRKEEESVERTLGQDSQNEKENKLTSQSPCPSVTPPPSKKRCRAPRGECEDKITETPLPRPTLTTQQEQRTQSSESHRPLPELCSDSKNELLSSPMLSKPEMMPSDINEISSVRKKRVRFGALLSPEFFDKTLPPSTPLQKGGTPMCPPSSTGKKRSLLKTPQRFEGPLPQPDFNSPQSNGASPVFVIDRRTTGLVYSDDVFDKIGFPSMDEESPSNRPSENCKDTLSAEDPGQPQAQDSEVMNAAFQVDEDEPSASQMEEKLPSATSDQPPALSIEVDLQSVGTSELQLSFNASTQPTRSRRRKRKQPGENEGEKRKSSRIAAASASGQMKKLTAGVKKRFGTKEVNRSLYGKRDFASKNPLLSPIFETTSANFNSTPTQPPSEKLPGAEKDDIQTPTVLQSQTDRLMVSLWSGSALSDATLTNEIEQKSSPVYQSDTGMTFLEPSASTESPAGRGDSGSKALKARRRSGRPARQRRSSGATKRRKFIDSVELEGETGDIDRHELIEAIGMNQNNSDGLELHESEHSETPNVVPNDPMSPERSEQKTPKRCGRVQKVLKSPCVKIDVVLEADERILDETEFSGSKAAPTEPALAPWQQTDFNIDDILKPVAKSRGSVRRSLRNRRSVDLQTVGLAWVDHTSPEFSKVGRRRTRGRLSGVSEPCVSLVSEEPTPDVAE
ncbi:cell division cycle-associated protein 2 isoform X2 [Triplophysa rosa]|uniref:cell division cycle-associated protein 2 isoform X2 n=1 Tax=Triplophysa rosa TaxID=992332 RepID=UPI00254618F4|nr:cell division cycle-associated protein 2 isoform X2 [Triplophysa rosa]